MPDELAEAWDYYVGVKSGMITPMTKREMDEQPTQWVSDLHMIITRAEQAREARR